MNAIEKKRVKLHNMSHVLSSFEALAKANLFKFCGYTMRSSALPPFRSFLSVCESLYPWLEYLPKSRQLAVDLRAMPEHWRAALTPMPGWPQTWVKLPRVVAGPPDLVGRWLFGLSANEYKYLMKFDTFHDKETCERMEAVGIPTVNTLTTAEDMAVRLQTFIEHKLEETL